MEIKEFSACNLESLRKLYLDSRRDSFPWLKADSFRIEDFDRDSQGERIWLSEVLGNVLSFISIWEPDNFIVIPKPPLLAVVIVPRGFCPKMRPC